jgi:hypothetical protein
VRGEKAVYFICAAQLWMVVIGPFACRTLESVLGIALPAARTYRCAKRDVSASSRPFLRDEMRRQSASLLQHWSVIVLLVCYEACAEWLVSWAPLYYEAKFAFILWLTLRGGTQKVYQRLVAPFFETYEMLIDKGLRSIGASVSLRAVDLASGAAARLRRSSVSFLSAGTDVLQMVARAEEQLVELQEETATVAETKTAVDDAGRVAQTRAVVDAPPLCRSEGAGTWHAGAALKLRRSARTPQRAKSSISIDSLSGGITVDFFSGGVWRTGRVKRVLRASNTASVAWFSEGGAPELTTVTLKCLAKHGTKVEGG